MTLVAGGACIGVYSRHCIDSHELDTNLDARPVYAVSRPLLASSVSQLVASPALAG